MIPQMEDDPRRTRLEEIGQRVIEAASDSKINRLRVSNAALLKLVGELMGATQAAKDLVAELITQFQTTIPSAPVFHALCLACDCIPSDIREKVEGQREGEGS